MHAANFTAAAPGTDAIGTIRCSYCHDVHNTRTGSPDGRPYIRGTWRGNPFMEDGPPLTSHSTLMTSMGNFPRVSKSSTTLGGYYINENYPGGNGSNVAGLTDTNINNWAGLCEMCHGTNKTGTWTATAIDSLDWVYNTTTGGTPSDGTTGDHADIWVFS